MQLKDFLSQNNIQPLAEAKSKKRALELISNMASDYLHAPTLARPILDSLISRERLGTTAIGQGVALPHCRIAGLTVPFVLLLTLKEGIDYQSLDGQTVDVLVALLLPEETHDIHLQLLASIATQLSLPKVLADIRAADSVLQLYRAIT